MHSSFKEIVEEIIARHHSLLRRELPKVTELLDKLSADCAENDSFCEARKIYEKVRTKVEAHLKDEELLLFPTGIALESGGAAPPSSIDLLERLTEMEKEHDGCGNALTTVCQMIATSVPQSALRDELLSTIELMHDDLRIHVEKENQQVHPRFIELFESRSH